MTRLFQQLPNLIDPKNRNLGGGDFRRPEDFGKTCRGGEFTLAPELFPTAMRASASGFAAAAAKVGATLGTFLLPQVKAAFGVTAVLVLMAVVALLGAVATGAFALEIEEGASLEKAGGGSQPAFPLT